MRRAQVNEIRQRLSADDVERVRLAWCDLHGVTRCKTVQPAVALRALDEGVGLVGTLALKDTSDRTAIKVFENIEQRSLEAYAGASNLVLLPDPGTFVTLPWAPGTAWMLGDSWFADGTPCGVEPRAALARALEPLQQRGLALRCGLEIEFHIYQLDSERPDQDPSQAAWPGPAPAVRLLHPGYRLLSEFDADRAHEALLIVEHTALALGLPLLSLEVEFGPSQFEAVFDVTDAMTAADQLVLFRSATRQALARAGYWASFMCRPPFENVMSSGWHLHQSVTDSNGANVFTDRGDSEPLSPLGSQWLAGLMTHARASSLLCSPTANSYERFQPGALAPTSVRWARDDRAALFRVVGEPGDPATRIENRLGEPAANPYLYLASQAASGLDGLQRLLALEAADQASGGAPMLASLAEAIDCLRSDAVLCAALGEPLRDALLAAKASEWARFSSAEDPLEFQRREYFGRF